MPGAVSLLLLLPLVAALPADWDESLPQATSFTSAGYTPIVRTAEVAVFQHRASSTIRLGADACLRVPPATLLEALVDYERQVGVMGNLAECRVLRRGERWQIAYERIRMPVVSDRDFTVRVTWGKDGSLHWLKYWSDDVVGYPRQKGVVRVPYHRGSWQLTPAPLGRGSRIRYQVSIDLGGWLPRWIARRGAGKEVPALFKSLRALLALRGHRAEPCTLPER